MDSLADRDRALEPPPEPSDSPAPDAPSPYRERVYDEPAPAPRRAAGPARRVLSVLLSRTVRRFAVVGLVNTTIDVALFALLHARLGIVAANFVSTSAGMTFSFLVNGRYTFGVRRVTLRRVFLFLVANGGTMWVLQPLLILLAHDLLAAPLLPAKLGALAVSVVTNFLLYRHVVWPERTGGTAPAEGDRRRDVSPWPQPAGPGAAREAARR